MRILVTGADGFLGSNLVRLLLERAYHVSVLVHPNSDSVNLEGLDVVYHKGDILDQLSVRNAVTGCDAVIHTAALTDVWPARSERIRRVNIEGTRNILDAVLEAGIPRLVYVGSGSSVNVPSQVHQHSFGLDYIESKQQALNLVLESVRTRNLPAVIVLPTFMLGPYSSPVGSGKMVCALALGKLRFYTRGGRNFVHVKDVAVAIANGLTEGTIGKPYIAGNENLSYRSFFQKAAKIIGQPEPRIRVPDWLILLIGRLSNMYGSLAHRAPLISYPMARISCINQFVSSREAAKDLHMPSTDIDTAIRDCYEFFIQKGILTRKTNYPG